MQSGEFPELQYIQARGDGGGRSMTQMVVIHATDNTASAPNEANYASRRTDNVSAHFYVDETTVIQALPLGHVAYGCFSMGNSRSVQFELCGLSNRLTELTIQRAALYVAKVCRWYGLPVQHVAPDGLRAGVKGISGHGDVTLAWGQGDHTDPGSSFDWGHLVGLVAAAGGGDPAPTPPPAAHTGRPELSKGSQGGWVRIAQGELWGNGFYPSGGIDGDFGDGTYRATRNFQSSQGIGVDGVIGPVTWGRLVGSLPTVQQGSNGLAVRKVQALCYAHGFDPHGVDGDFGANTKAAVVKFQQFKQIGVDGIVGPQTWGQFVPDH